MFMSDFHIVDFRLILEAGKIVYKLKWLFTESKSVCLLKKKQWQKNSIYVFRTDEREVNNSVNLKLALYSIHMF